jgi:predicted transglutaminase-like cysteine proteinase
MALLLKAAALAAVLVSAPLAQAPKTFPDKAPIDVQARAKAPNEDPKLVDIIAEVNRYVNENIQGESDLEHYGMEDMWVQYPADGKGDCEDYALTKLGMLEQLGVPVVTNTKLVSVIVKEPGGVEGHEILAILMPKGAVLYLDNMNRHLMTRPELEREGYTFFDWKA